MLAWPLSVVVASPQWASVFSLYEMGITVPISEGYSEDEMREWFQIHRRYSDNVTSG